MMDVPLRSESADAGIRSIFDEAVSLKEKDPEKCKDLLRKAAGSGCSASMVLLGDILIDGTQEEKQEALSLFRKAYECGNGMGSRNLGYCFALGLGAGKDKEEAARWYLVSAESGNAKAQCNLGVLYEYGHGVDRLGEGEDRPSGYRDHLLGLSGPAGCRRGRVHHL